MTGTTDIVSRAAEAINASADKGTRLRFDKNHGLVERRQPRPAPRRQGTRAGVVAAALREG